MPWRWRCTSSQLLHGRLGYGHLRSQLLRAADSIATNIAEDWVGIESRVCAVPRHVDQIGFGD